MKGKLTKTKIAGEEFDVLIPEKKRRYKTRKDAKLKRGIFGLTEIEGWGFFE